MLILTTDGRALEFHGAHITITTKHGTPYYCVNVIEYNGSRAVNNQIPQTLHQCTACKEINKKYIFTRTSWNSYYGVRGNLSNRA